MTTTQKLWLGFGTLTAILVLSSLAILVRVQAIAGNVQAAADLARVRTASSRQLETHVLRHTLAVSAWLESGQSQYRDEMAVESNQIEQLLASYSRAAETDREHELASRAAALWHSYAAATAATLEVPVDAPRPDDFLAPLLAERRRLLEFVVGDMQPDANAKYNAGRDAALGEAHAVVGFVLALLLVGVGIAVLTSVVVAGGVVRAETERQQLAVTLESFVSQAPVGLALVDGQLRYQRINASLAALNGLSVEAHAGRRVPDVIPSIWPELEPVYRQVLESGQPVLGLEISGESVWHPRGRVTCVANFFPVEVAGEGPPCVGIAVLDITDRKRAEEQSARFAEELRLVTDAMPALISYVDAQGHYRFNNRAYEQWFGIERGALIGRHLREVLGDEGYARLQPCVSAALAGQRTEFEGEIPYRTGGTRYIHADYVPDVRDDGTVAGYYALVSDISARRLAEEALRESEERLRLALDGAQIGMWSTQVDSGETVCTVRTLEIFGLPDPTAVPRGPDWLAMVHADDRPQVLDAWHRCVERAEPYEAEYRICRADGTTRWVLSRGATLGDGQRQPRRVVGITMDVSERRRIEQELREREAIFRSLGEAVPDFLWMSDDQGRPIYQNPAWRQFTGLSHEDLEQRGWEIVHHEDDLPALQQRWHEATAGGEAFQVEARVRRHDGEYRWFAGRTVPLQDETGRVIQWVGTMTDIHDLKLAEAALRDADRRKDEFLATLAHELRNPLAPIRSAVELLQLRGAVDETSREAHQIIDRQLSHMVRLIDDLLDVSRITRGKLELRTQPVALDSIVHQAVEASRPHADRAHHRLSVTLPEQPVMLQADPVRLAQVLSNLLNNACKYTEPHGQIWLSATLDDRTVAISVRDTGVGISAEHLPRLFEMFSQVKSALERSQGGLGIGLSLARGLVEMHGGTLEAHSAGAGQGSEFIVRLPVLADVPIGSPQARGPALHSSTAPEACRIVVADDNHDAAHSLAMMLRVLGHDVQTAADGQQAIELCDSYRPQLVLLDIGMPRLNGYDAARAIRERGWGRDVQLVALTGWGQQEDKLRAQSAGFDAHLVKPVALDALQAVLEQVRG